MGAKQPRVTRCGSCNAAVIWTVTHLGKPMPVDAEPVDDGNVLVDCNPTSGRCTSVVHGTDVVVMAVGSTQSVHVSHFATCPQAKSWRHKK